MGKVRGSVRYGVACDDSSFCTCFYLAFVSLQETGCLWLVLTSTAFILTSTGASPVFVRIHPLLVPIFFFLSCIRIFDTSAASAVFGIKNSPASFLAGGLLFVLD